MMRPAVLSISQERVVGPIRNTILAHAGYGVIPATTAQSALGILGRRHVCVMVIAHSVSKEDQRLLCLEGHRRGVAAVVLDPYGALNAGRHEVHFNPLDGPEAFLEAIATAMQREHHRCVAESC